MMGWPRRLNSLIYRKRRTCASPHLPSQLESPLTRARQSFDIQTSAVVKSPHIPPLVSAIKPSSCPAPPEKKREGHIEAGRTERDVI